MTESLRPDLLPPESLLEAVVAVDPAGLIAAPVRLIDLEREIPSPEITALARAAASATGVVVGVCRSGPPHPSATPLVAALDVTLVPVPVPGGRETVLVPDVLAAAAAITATAQRFPCASAVLAGLLRWSGSLPEPAALDAESFAYSTLLAGPEFAGWLGRRGARPLPPPVAEPVRVERAGGVLLITLNRPERRNAYGRQVRDALVDALTIAELDETVSRVVLAGAGPAFCAGGDLDEFGTTPDLVTAHFVRTRGGAALPLSRLSGIMEVRLQGPCVGAGIELPAFAGRVRAAPDSRFRLPEISMGLIPGAGGTVSIPRRIGRWRTCWLALTGSELDVATALEWGLVDEVLPG